MCVLEEIPQLVSKSFIEKRQQRQINPAAYQSSNGSVQDVSIKVMIELGPAVEAKQVKVSKKDLFQHRNKISARLGLEANKAEQKPVDSTKSASGPRATKSQGDLGGPWS